MQVRIDEQLAAEIYTGTGLRQGESLTTTTFILILNEFIEILKELKWEIKK